MIWNAPTRAEFRRWARTYLVLMARDASDHLIERKRVTVTVELRNGTQHEIVEEAWV